MNNYTYLGVAVGLGFALLVAVDGFSGFLWGIVFCAIGAAIGAHFDDHINLKDIWQSLVSSRGGKG